MPNPVALSIQVLGPFVVTRDGMPVPAHELASRKGRTLLKLLLARRGGVVPAEVLAEALWGDRPPADPDANLATLVSRLRAVLGPDAIAGGRDGRLQRPFAYRWRVELRHAELASRLEPAAAERLLDLAGTYGSAKYRALALARLGRNREALQVAAPVGSDYLLAQVAGGALARAALDRMAAALPPELRPAFMDRGRLAATLAGR
jgi:DNA-binding SARP family transcriptional activator